MTKELWRGGLGSLRFHIKDLPETIADAVFVCQSLGIAYLWVDALCIIQDDGQDKVEQIGQMHQIYSQSIIAIVASRADSSMDGFLHPRILRDTFCRLPYRSKEGDEGSFILHLEGESAKLREPLHKRGWTYQEFLLPPRFIEYGRLQTIFQCRECKSTITDNGGEVGYAHAMFLEGRMGFKELFDMRRGLTELGEKKVLGKIDASGGGGEQRPSKMVPGRHLEGYCGTI